MCLAMPSKKGGETSSATRSTTDNETSTKTTGRQCVILNESTDVCQ